MNKYLIVLILFVSGVLLFYRLSELLFFIGDVGWFYISARDLLLTGNIPLTGIPSSHPWLHQGPIWTYLLAIGLFIFRFDPIAGGVIAVLFGLGSVYLLYRVGRELFSEQTGIIAAVLYASSPLVIIHARMPYHTAPIPFFTLLLLFSIIKWIKGNPYFFSLALFSVSMLYNFELATIIYGVLLLGIVAFGFWKKTKWIAALKKQKLIVLSSIAFLLPLIPILTYDTQHGFPQTLKFAAWMGYKLLTLFGYPKLHPEIPGATVGEVLSFFLSHIQTLLFLPNFFIGTLLFFVGFFFVLYELFREKKLGTILLGIFLIVGLGGFLAAKTTSEAYLPMLFPTILLSVGFFFSRMFDKPVVKVIAAIFFIAVVVGNTTTLLQENYLMGRERGGYGPTFTQRFQAATEVVNLAGKNQYTIKGKGPGSQFEGFIMPYAYLTWWKGHGPAEHANVQFVITESLNSVSIEKKEK